MATVTDASFSYSSGTPIDLDQSDIKKITKIQIGGIDATDKFILDNGQRPGFYGEGRLIPVGTVASATVVVSFQYYQHGSGDYFTVDSYDSSEYDSIPTFHLVPSEIISSFIKSFNLIISISPPYLYRYDLILFLYHSLQKQIHHS